MMIKSCCLVLAAVLLGGCDQVDNYIESIVQKIQAQQKVDSTTRLQDQLDSQSQDLLALKAEVDELKVKTSLHEIQLDNVDVTEAVVSEGGTYGLAKTRQGIFTVSIEKLEPYLDGYKATLHIGNTTTLTMLGGEFEVKWGLPWGAPNKRPNEIWSSRKSKKFSFAQNFAAGSYTAIEVALTPARPEEVKTLNVSPIWNRISLRVAGPK